MLWYLQHDYSFVCCALSILISLAQNLNCSPYYFTNRIQVVVFVLIGAPESLKILAFFVAKFKHGLKPGVGHWRKVQKAFQSTRHGWTFLVLLICSGMVTIKFRSELPTFKELLESNLVRCLAHDCLNGPRQTKGFSIWLSALRWHGPSRCHSRKLPWNQIVRP